MPLFSKRKSGKPNSKGAKHAEAKEGATLLPNSFQQPPEVGRLSQQQFLNGVPYTANESNSFLDRNIQHPSSLSAKCVANFPRKSRLSKSLPEVLVDDSILPLLMEYLQKQGVQNVLNFWLAAETFCLSCRDKTYYKSRLKKQPKVPSCNIPQRKVENTTSDCDIGTRNTSGIDRGDLSGERTPESNFVDSLNNQKVESLASNSRPEDRGINDPESVNTNDNYTSSDEAFDSGRHEDNTEDLCLNKNTSEIQYQNENASAAGIKESETVKESRQHSKTMMDDAISIYRHFISLDATQPVFGFDENIRRDVESNICSENGEIDHECFKVAQKLAFETLQNRYYDGFLRSSYYQKHIMDILTSGKVFLADVMYNDDAVFYFMEFIEQEGKSYLLAFWFAVDSFRQELQVKLDKQEYNLDHALADAMILYDKYFSMQATQSLGVSDETRIRIENKICREGGPLPDCFQEPMENILTLLEEVYFPLFLESSVYFKYLTELFNTVGDIETGQACLDDSSSTASVSETTRLLESLANDAELQEDPDEIWQRPNVGLSIGRVNEYGIYVPAIEPQPDSKNQKAKGTTLGQKMRKFVSGDSYKVKEEMAWQVAKMVLEDVKKQQKNPSQ